VISKADTPGWDGEGTRRGLGLDESLVFSRHRTAPCAAHDLESEPTKDFARGFAWLVRCMGTGLALLGPRVADDMETDLAAARLAAGSRPPGAARVEVGAQSRSVSQQ